MLKTVDSEFAFHWPPNSENGRFGRFGRFCRFGRPAEHSAQKGRRFVRLWRDFSFSFAKL